MESSHLFFPIMFLIFKFCKMELKFGLIIQKPKRSIGKIQCYVCTYVGLKLIFA